MNTHKQAFTLVELIVVITILAILWTIAFISLQWYSEDARDSTRVSDINNIKISLELFSLATWKYPLPDNSQDVTYSWSTLWNQWTIWNQVITNLSRNLSKIPTDPLYGTEYVYSTLENKKEYELMSLYEWSNVSSNGLLNTTYAATNTTVRMDGTYNWLFIKTANYIIPTPSIITADTLPWVLDSDSIQSQVTNGGTNIPNMWIAKISVSTGALSSLSLSVYNWSIDGDSSTVEKLAVYEVLKWAYTGSSLANKWIYKTLLAQTTDDEKIAFAGSVVVNNSTPSNTNEIVIETLPWSCKDILNNWDSTWDGTYTVDPQDNWTWFSVYCNMTTNWGGWELIWNNSTNIIGTLDISSNTWSWFDLDSDFTKAITDYTDGTKELLLIIWSNVLLQAQENGVQYTPWLIDVTNINSKYEWINIYRDAWWYNDHWLWQENRDNTPTWSDDWDFYWINYMSNWTSAWDNVGNSIPKEKLFWNGRSWYYNHGNAYDYDYVTLNLYANFNDTSPVWNYAWERISLYIR